MKRRVFYTVGRRNPLVWLAALAALLAFVGYIANVTCGKGAGVSGAQIWLRTVLPALAALYFTYQLPVNGKDRVYRLSLPFWLLAPGFIYEILGLGLAWYWTALLILAELVLCVLLHRALSGSLAAEWLVIVVPGLCMAAILWTVSETLRQPFSWDAWLGFLPDLLLLLAWIPLCFALRVQNDGAWHPTWGDRFDGRKIRSLSPISVVGTYIMP